MSYSSEVLADSPWGFWEFVEDLTAPVVSSGSDATDWSIASGAEFGRPAIPTGSTGTAARSTGAGIASRASIPASLAGDNVTAECWFTMPSGGAKGSLIKFGSSGGDGWAIGLGNTQFDNVGSKIILLAENIAWQPTSATVPAGNHHLVVTRGASRAITIYLDGASVWTGTLTAPNTPLGMTVGGHVNGAYAFYLPSTVPMDEVAFYASALSSARVTAHYNGGAGSDAEVAADSPVILLHLDESLSTTYADASGNDRTLLPTGAKPAKVAGPITGVDGQNFPAAASSLETSASYLQPNTVTYEFWLKFDALPATDTLVMAFGGSGTAGITSGVYLRATGKMQFSMYTGSGANIETPTALSAGDWHHVACSVGAAGAKIRVDKTTAATSATTSVMQAAVGKFYVRTGGPNTASGTGALTLAMPATWYGSQLSDARTDAHYDAMTTASGAAGTIGAALPALAANLTGSIKFSGAITALLPALGANLSGTSTIAGVAGTISAPLPLLGASLAGAYSDAATLAAILPPLSANLTGTYAPPPVTGTLAANLPSLAANLAATAYEPGMSGTLDAVLPALSALLSGDVLGRNGFGLALDSTATLTVLEQVDTTTLPTPTGTPGVPATVLHIIAPTVPAPTLVNGRPQ